MKCDGYFVASLSIFQMAISGLKPLFQLFDVQVLLVGRVSSRFGGVAVEVSRTILA
jgi:hypothetical protein